MNDQIKRHDDYISMPTTAGPGFKCQEPDQVNLLGNVENDSIPMCEYYKELMNGVVGCFKCKHGFGGKIT